MMIKQIPINTKGVDYIVGDIHGKYSKLIENLKTINFDFSKDRLFCTGDLVDRGSQNEECLSLINQDWFETVVGNHELMCLDNHYHSNQYPEMYRMHAANGGEWFCVLDDEQQKPFVEKIEALPVMLEVQIDEHTKVGIVHGNVGYDWEELKEEVKNIKHISGSQNRVLMDVLWGRTRISTNNKIPCQNISHVFVGHSPVQNIKTLGNVSYIDTGVVFGLNEDFTIINIKEYLKSTYNLNG